MGDFETLIEAARPFCEKLETLADLDSEICIVTHHDADGITSGSILGLAIARMGAKFCLRCVPDFNLAVLNQIAQENYEFVILSDLGAGFSDALRKSLGVNWFVVDHHQIPQEEVVTDDQNQIFNPWKVGVDGSTQISAGGMAFLVASGMAGRNNDLSSLAVISAVADRQDQGEKRSLVGPNDQIVKKAESLSLIQTDLDIILAGRETRPCHEALAYTCFPYIEGLTWHPDACHALLNGAGIKLRESGRWRVVTELSQDEKSLLINAVAEHISREGKNPASIIDKMIGFVYTLAEEEPRTQLRDAREFGTLLNACGRTGNSGIGISVCFGDRFRAPYQAEEVSRNYRTTLRSHISTIFSDGRRIIEGPNYIMVIGDGLIAGSMLGAVSSLLSGSPKMEGKIIFVRTLVSEDSDSYKFSCRKGIGAATSANLGILMRQCATAVGGTGGGHIAAAGCKIPAVSINKFVDLLIASVKE